MGLFCGYVENFVERKEVAPIYAWLTQKEKDGVQHIEVQLTFNI